jgi:hypothetical protein
MPEQWTLNILNTLSIYVNGTLYISNIYINIYNKTLLKVLFGKLPNSHSAKNLNPRNHTFWKL